MCEVRPASRPVEAVRNVAHSFWQTRSQESLVYYHFDSLSHEQYISHNMY